MHDINMGLGTSYDNIINSPLYTEKVHRLLKKTPHHHINIIKPIQITSNDFLTSI